MTVEAVRQWILSISLAALSLASLQAQADERSEFAILAGMAATIHKHCSASTTAASHDALERELQNLVDRNGLSTEFKQGVELGLRKVRNADFVEICSTNAQQNYLIVLASVVAPLQASSPQMFASN